MCMGWDGVRDADTPLSVCLGGSAPLHLYSPQDGNYVTPESGTILPSTTNQATPAPPHRNCTVIAP